MNQLLKKIFILPIRFYQVAISPLLGSNCRFTPTCSHYMVEAIQEWGVLKGVWLGLKRIGKCHPWGPHGHDPVPKKKNSSNRQSSCHCCDNSFH
ncbi:MAG: membrane protein insertion efficiency factor YidD [Bacteroidota bacterium]